MIIQCITLLHFAKLKNKNKLNLKEYKLIILQKSKIMFET